VFTYAVVPLQCDYDRLQLSTSSLMERNTEFLIECMDDLSLEQQKVILGLHLVCCCFRMYLTEISSILVPILLSEPVSSTSSAASMASKEKVWFS